jgi:hypothetical protein
MFLLELSSWLLLSMILVIIHVYTTRGPHPRSGLLLLNGVLWGVTGGLLGTVIRLREADTGTFNVLALGLAGLATVAVLVLEWLSGHEHPGRKAHR